MGDITQRERARLRDVVLREGQDRALRRAVENLQAAARRVALVKHSIAIPLELPAPAGAAALAIAAAAFRKPLFPAELGAVPPRVGAVVMVEPRQLVALIAALASVVASERRTLVEAAALDEESSLS